MEAEKRYPIFLLKDAEIIIVPSDPELADMESTYRPPIDFPQDLSDRSIPVHEKFLQLLDWIANLEALSKSLDWSGDERLAQIWTEKVKKARALTREYSGHILEPKRTKEDCAIEILDVLDSMYFAWAVVYKKPLRKDSFCGVYWILWNMLSRYDIRELRIRQGDFLSKILGVWNESMRDKLKDYRESLDKNDPAQQELYDILSRTQLTSETISKAYIKESYLVNRETHKEDMKTDLPHLPVRKALRETRNELKVSIEPHEMAEMYEQYALRCRTVHFPDFEPKGSKQYHEQNASNLLEEQELIDKLLKTKKSRLSRDFLKKHLKVHSVFKEQFYHRVERKPDGSIDFLVKKQPIQTNPKAIRSLHTIAFSPPRYTMGFGQMMCKMAMNASRYFRR